MEGSETLRIFVWTYLTLSPTQRKRLKELTLRIHYMVQ